ncbi:MAG TPA: serine hydrolase domain-containing protein [Gemmatimonadales bacterium]
MRPASLLSVTAGLLVAPFAVALGQRSPTPSDGVSRRVDSTVAAYMAAHQVPGLSLAIGVDGRLVWSHGYGVADLENQVPVTPISAFRTGSIGKPMTATAVMQLWEEGKLDLDAPVQSYCPAFPVKRWPITARQLLAHLAGIRDKTPDEETNYHHYETLAAALAIFGGDSLIAEPGTAFHYTSYGYDVLGCVIEGAAGVPYLDYMTQHIFGPAGMTHTRLDDAREIIPHRVRGYVLDSAGPLRNAVHDDMSNRIPAGGFVSTAEDLVHFGTSLLDGALVADSTRQLMFRVPNGANGQPLTDDVYALGWAVGTWYGVQEVMHGGGTPQACAFLYLLPERRFVVAFMMNLEAVPDRGDLAGDLATIVLGPRAPHR